MRVAVIGGGWAGIAAAVELTASGVATTLFEAGRVLGGRARSAVLDGRRVDNGQHILLGAYAETLALMRQVGANPEALLERRPLRVADNSGFSLGLAKLPAPLNLAVGLLGAHRTGLIEKLRTALWMDRIKRRRFLLDKESSVAEWLDAAGQNGTLRRHLWQPLCLAALNTPVERASAQVFANVLRDSLGSPRRADTDLLLPRRSLGDLLPNPAQSWLTAHGATLRLGQRVHRLEAVSAGMCIDGETFDAAILAVAPQHAGALWPVPVADYAYEPIATVYLQFDPKTSLPFPLFNLLGGIGQWVVDRGQGLLAGVLSGHGNWEALDDAQLAAVLAQELHAAWPATGPVAWHKVVREKRATFSCRPELPRPDFRTTDPRLLLAGDYTWADYPATLEGAVRSGRRAACEMLGGTRHRKRDKGIPE